jgi:purine-binding chemotaxis protein CheW
VAAAPPPPPPGAPRIEDALRAELAELETGHRPGPDEAAVRPPVPAQPSAAAPEAHAAAPVHPVDPLAEFFWREDEVAPALPDLGLSGALRSAVGAAEERKEYVVFFLGPEEYAVPITRVREVLKPPGITEVPRAPAHVVGMITLRGEVVAVVDPRLRLGLPRTPPGPRSRIVVCEGRDGPLGLLVDAVSEVARLPAGAIELQPQLAAGTGEAVAGIGRDGQRLYILLDLDEVVRAGPARGAGAIP